jgi:hypothetical protein
MNNEQEIIDFVDALNKSWTVEKQPEKLSEYFHQDMVSVSPNYPERLVGREACVKSWTYFSEKAEIEYWKEFDHLVHIYNNGNAAVLNYYFETAFKMGGNDIVSKGRDMFFLIKENGRWWVVANQFSSML